MTSSAIRSRFEPVLRGRRVAYSALIGSGSRARVAVYTQLLGSKGRPRRLPGGSDGLEPEPDRIAFDGRRVAYAWQLSEAPCAGDELFGNSTELWIDDLRGGGHRLAHRAGCPGEAGNKISGGHLSGGALYFAEFLNDATSRIGRYTLKTRQLSFAATRFQNIVRVASEGNGRYLLLQQTGGGKAQVLRARLTFSP